MKVVVDIDSEGVLLLDWNMVIMGCLSSSTF